MANPIVEEVQKMGESVEQMRKANDERIEKLEKGLESRSKELDIVTDKYNRDITTHKNKIDDLLKEREADRVRLELLEAAFEKPKGTPTEQLEQKELQIWTKYLRGKMEDKGLRDQVTAIQKQVIEAKADTTLIGSALLGGNAVPTVIGTAIERLMLAASDILPEVKMVTAGTSDYNELVTIPGANGGWVAEAGSRAQTNNPNIRKVTITHGELFAYPKISNWSLNDIMFNVVDWVQSDIADTMGISLSTAILSGSGSSQPTGITHSAPTSGTDGASPMRAAAVFQYVPGAQSPVTTLIGDNLIDVQTKLRRPYRGNAKWAMNTTTEGAVRKLKDSYGQYLWQTNYQAGNPATLLGRPIIIWEDLGDTTSANALPVAYGDFSRAYLLAKIGMMEMIQDKVTAPGYTQFFTYQRWGGIPLNNDAVKFLKMSAT